MKFIAEERPRWVAAWRPGRFNIQDPLLNGRVHLAWVGVDAFSNYAHLN